MIQYKIWRSYWQQEQYYKYNVLDNKNVIPFNTTDIYLKADNINYLNGYLGELVMFYYIWKNNLKSNIIFIDQYSKRFIDIYKANTINLLNKNSVIATWVYFSKNLNHKWINNDIIDKFNTYIFHKYKMKLECQYYIKFWWLMFGCKWEIFCDICDFIFGFLDYLFPNKNWKDIDNLEEWRLLQLQNGLNDLAKYPNDFNKDLMYEYNDLRLIPLIFEHLLSVYISNKYNIIVANNINLKQINNENNI